MNREEFAARAVGIPWKRWCSTWQRVDCFGLLVLDFREELHVDLGEVPRTTLSAGFAAARGWQRCGPELGATAWMAYGPDHEPQHCGLLLPNGDVLHAHGSEEKGGSVRVHSMAVIERLFGEVRFYRYTPCS